MSCGHCKAAVEDEVKHSNADVEKGTVEVAYDDSRVSTEQLMQAIEEAGYTVAA